MSIFNRHPSIRQSTTQQIATGLLWRGAASVLGTMQNTRGSSLIYDLQELIGAVSIAWNKAVDLGRDVAPEDFTEWTGTPAITDLGSNVAHWDGTAGTQNLFIQSPPSPEGMQNKIWRFTFTVSNYVGGAIGSRVGDTAGNSYSADGTYIDEYTAVGNNDTILLAGNSFEGDVDLKLVEVQQTDILASSAYSTPGDNPLDGDDTGTTPGEFTESRMILKGYDGTAYTDLLSAEHNSILNPSSFAVGLFFKRPTYDTTERYLLHYYVDANNYIGIRWTTNAGELAFDYMSGGTLEQVLYATGSPTALSHAAIQVESGVMQALFNGVQVGTDQAVAAPFVGNFTAMLLGAGTDTPTGGFDGGLGYDGEYTNAVAESDWQRITNSGGVI